MRKLQAISFSLLLLCFFSACKKEHGTTILSQVSGSWALVSTIPNATGLFFGREIFATSSGLIAAGVGFSTENISYSSDHGVTWTVLFDSTTHGPGSAVFLDPNNNAHLVTYSQPDSTFYVSADGGQTWTLLNHPTVSLDSTTRMQFAGVSGSNLFAINYSFDSLNGSIASANLLKSTNNGNSWAAVSNNSLIAANLIPVGGYVYNGIYVRGLYNQLFINTNSGNLYSTDNGNTWSAQASSVTGVTLEGFAASYLMGFVPNSNSIYRSADTGQTWVSLSLPNLSGYNSLSACYGFDSVVVASGVVGSYTMVCQNITKGVWHACDAGLMGMQGIFFTDNEYVYLSSTNTLNGGSINLYRRPISDFVGL